MIAQYKKIKNLFLRQSYLDSWEDYESSIHKSSFIKWDYIILTASNEAQAAAFDMQIQNRLEKGLLPSSTRYAVLPDPDGKRVGSGGATFNVLKYIAQQEPGVENPFAEKRILVIHSGGDSKRVPQYSAVGKLFSPVPRELPDGRASTLFDEFIIGMSGVPSRFREGMLVLSGDVLLLFNPLQIDVQFDGAVAISIKEPAETGKDHGVFLSDGHGCVKNFLHKQTEETLRTSGAVNEQGAVDLDTGAILMDVDMLKALYGLISTDGEPDDEKFRRFANERARVSFYGDILYPLASASTLEQYYKEAPEGELTEELMECRTELWKILRQFSLKLICLSPAQFIHFGTTGELRRLMAEEIADYEFLDWKNRVMSTLQKEKHYTAYESYVGHRARVGEHVYLEDSYVLGESWVGAGSIVSCVKLREAIVPEDVVVHGLPLKNGRQVVRIYGVKDNPKGLWQEDAGYLKTTLRKITECFGIEEEQLWPEKTARDLWNARLFPVCDTQEEALNWASVLYEIATWSAECPRAGGHMGAVKAAFGAVEQLRGVYCPAVESAVKGCRKESCPDAGMSGLVSEWLATERISLCDSFNQADTERILAWQKELECRILCRRFIDGLSDGKYYKDALSVFGSRGMSAEVYRTLMEDAQKADFSLKIRIYYAVSGYMKANMVSFDGRTYDYVEGLCFGTIQRMIYEESVKKLPEPSSYRIAGERVDIQLPVRVNWGGGWTDTPPYCNENGGVVLNAAISLNGILPIQITVKKLSEYHIEFESQDIGVQGTVTTVEEIQDCHNPYDSFALHKAALIAAGLIPLEGSASLQELLKKIGGGIYLSTQVVGIPKGSGLGTSSILAGACVKGLFRFLGQEKTNQEIYEVVLCMEQIMSTGGGWQDQVGGLTGGIKLITTAPGMEQDISVEQVELPEAAMKELQERFALIYTGQRRLARNLLRDVVGGYIGARPESVDALRQMQAVAVLMKFHLERGEIDEFAELLNRHWELSRQLDSGSTNTCIDQIFLACEDLIDGRFISGAGGGGFIMVIMKKGVSRQMLRERLRVIFQSSGVDVWDSEFV